MNILNVTNEFHAAVIAMETTWEMLKQDRENRKLLARYIRALRRCDRLRSEMKNLMETGRL
jgi:hypothetical protein